MLEGAVSLSGWGARYELKECVNCTFCVNAHDIRPNCAICAPCSDCMYKILQKYYYYSCLVLLLVSVINLCVFVCVCLSMNHMMWLPFIKKVCDVEEEKEGSMISCVG